MTDLEKARREIDAIDGAMAELFVRRMEAVRTVAAYKQKNGIRVTDLAREREVIRHNARRVENETLRPYYVDFLQSNMEISKAYQHRLLEGMRVAFSGVEGAFANIAANRVFPDATAVPCADFKAAYDAVADGECDCVILPIENSYNGDVGQVMDLAFFGPLSINGIYDIEVVQNLLAVKGTTMEEVRQVISHPQALGQCAAYIRRHGFEPVEAVNTAVAVRQVAEMGRHDIAAIGSDEAARKFELKKLEAHINESGNNTTRFAVFSKLPKAPAPSDNQFILLFTVQNEAGSLGEAVAAIGRYGFNLRALKSRPTKELIWSYYFYAEGEGNIHSDRGREMLQCLREKCSTLRVVGSFEKEIVLRGDEE